MKNLLVAMFSVFLMTAFTGDKLFPKADVKTVEGQTVNIGDYIAKGKPTVVSFWATWCSPCKRELDAIGEIYPDWQDEYGVNLIAISIDDARASAKIPGLIASKGWDYTVLIDSPQKFGQELGFQTIPQTFLLDGEGKIVYTHNGYSPGDEFELEDKIKALVGR